MNQDERPLALVTGATGYVGGRLVPQLLEAGYRVRCLVRGTSRLASRTWRDQVEVVSADVLEPSTLPAALQGVDVAYYLIHSMRSHGEDFVDRDRKAARDFSQAAENAGVERIVYLGGLGDPDADLSEHLSSRQETGDALRSTSVPVTELRAGVIVGSGSLSFEMIRYLTERLPAMICPSWVSTRIQPIAVRDAIDYLVAAGSVREAEGRIVEIGGVDVITYRDMMKIYAEQRGLPRLMIPVPILTPRLSSLWVHLITPVPTSIARPLIEGLRNEVIVRDPSAREIFPDIEPVGYPEAVRRALSNLDADEVETAWSDAFASTQGDTPPVELKMDQGILIERRQRLVDAPAEVVYEVFTGLGGRRGWHLNGLWHLRGALDRLIGVVGFRRGRRDAEILREGEALDFWRVETVEPGRRLLLRAEMKLPGRGWLEFRADPPGTDPDGGPESTRLIQAALFAPKGLSGLLYWYALYPMHAIIFSRMIDALVVEAETRARASRPR